ncbi:ArsR/SmtB family transcription factor [Natronolimnobius baerhuensis]|uniref:ArsR family transcriptional regulator n=1 Tax=Natronolimnobius baerhuensis TaxID=253108 RepID=A0A202EBL3_9EURY|nr:helix-turn-helix domain-containing protein [Natronolimnobius baerhuensis]OVE85370.1 ArsR family transcriptional regulator [Natronolimnobius baerhuensis]
MARLFPFRSETPSQEGQPRVVDLEGEDADAVFSALSSTTARQIYARLDDEPGTPSDIADAIDSSIQNVRYHLENLEEAGLVEVVDTWYSSRGNEMSVYATTDGPLIVTSDESTASQLKAAISRLIGGIGALAGGSLLVQYGVTQWAGSHSEDAVYGSAATDDTADDQSETLEVQDESVDSGAPVDETDDSTDTTESEDSFGTQTVDDDADSSEDDAADAEDDGATDAEDDTATAGDESYDSGRGGDEAAADDAGSEEFALDAAEGADPELLSVIPPGLLFFLGGLVVLLAVWLYWYWYRPAY